MSMTAYPSTSFNEYQLPTQQSTANIHYTNGHIILTNQPPFSSKRKCMSPETHNEILFRPSKRHKASVEKASFESLPGDLVGCIGSFLDVASLNNARLINRRISAIMNEDSSGWREHYKRLLDNKCHVPSLIQSSEDSQSAKKAYFSAWKESLREEIKSDEFIFDPENPSGSTIWSFRFKKSAGQQWTTDDPWHNGGEARNLVFLRDGTLREINFNSDNEVDNMEGEMDIQYRTPFLEVLGEGAPEVGWSCVQRPLDFKTRSNRTADGKTVFPYIRLTVDGRDVPTYVVRRFRPNWGFVLENCWGIFTSFKMPTLAERNKRLQQLYLDVPFTSLSLALSNYRNAKRIHSSSTTTNISSDSRGYKQEFSPEKLALESIWNLCDDSCLAVNGSIQWRESMLYNIGIEKLPDSEQARIVFDNKFRLLQNTMHSHS